MDATENQRLRAALRDLVAVSTIPATWVGREPPTIATGLADALVGSLRLDFAFVRLRDPITGVVVDASRGDAWTDFAAWLRDHDVWEKVTVSDVGHPRGGYTGLVLPVGVHSEGGLVSVASRRADFPTETDQLLISVAANQAAMAFQSARLAEERRDIADALRHSRDELEMTVAERTAELHRATTELQTILDASPVGIVLFRADFTVQRWNAAFERLFGWSADELARRPSLLADEIDDGWSPVLDALEKAAAPFRMEIRMQRKDRSEFDASVACAPLTHDDGSPAGFVANIGDISDRKTAEASLQKTRAELVHVTRVMTLGELAASIAHEINQPLTAIIADASVCLNLLSRPVPDLAMVRQVLTEVLAGGHRAGNVIKRLRELATKADPHRTLVDLNAVIREVAALVGSEVQRHDATLRLTLAPHLPLVYSDRVQLQQVLINLVMNGLEAMDAVTDRPRRLTIGSEAIHTASVRVAVHDVGVGIDPQQADRMFDAFFTTKSSGMGMGLSISRSIIEGHGGRLWATPNAKVGATLQFELPAAK
ncbi:MAG TPA: ATP-binding protein [Gemmatimonadaceae bacterium]|nr:ATP-binding protein [Gemmatimonadaceae bacterium]